MKKFASIAALVLFATAVFTGCGKEEPRVPLIEGLTTENFPIMDCSTSTAPLIQLTAAKLLGYNGGWVQKGGNFSNEMETNLPAKFREQKLRYSQTHGSFLNLVDGGADMIFSARTMSPDEKAYADAAGVTLIETPIALDALVFIKHPGISVESVTHEQLKDIYNAGIKNWNEVGGDDMEIVPFLRNPNSGSQELMESLVMGEPMEYPESGYFNGTPFEDFQSSSDMVHLVSGVGQMPGALGYTVYYYLYNMVGHLFGDVLPLGVEGVVADKEAIADRSYPFVAEVYLIIRDDLDRQSMAYRVYEYMQTPAGKRIVEESGYVPN